MKRKGKISRKTKETSISVDLNIDGKGKYKIDTGIGFLNHMLEQLSKHSSIDMNIKAKGDTHIDLHHTTEDTGIAIGEALKKALKKSVGIRRYAHAMIPMDETLSRVALDKFPACFSNFHSNLSNNVKASAVDPAKPATTSLFSIFLTFEAVLFTTVFPMLTCPSPATTTSLFFLTNTIVVIAYKWILNLILQAQV